MPAKKSTPTSSFKQTRTRAKLPEKRGPGGGTEGVRGNPEFEPTKDQRLIVECLVANGCTHVMIAEEIGCDEITLRKYFRHELDEGSSRLVSRIGSTVAQQALKGCIKSQRLFLDRRGGDEWRFRQAFEHSGPGGAPMQTQEVANLTDEELAVIAKLYKGTE